jgi:hypothetical protein
MATGDSRNHDAVRRAPSSVIAVIATLAAIVAHQ